MVLIKTCCSKFIWTWFSPENLKQAKDDFKVTSRHLKMTKSDSQSLVEELMAQILSGFPTDWQGV